MDVVLSTLYRHISQKNGGNGGLKRIMTDDQIVVKVEVPDEIRLDILNFINQLHRLGIPEHEFVGMILEDFVDVLEGNYETRLILARSIVIEWHNNIVKVR